MEEQVITMPDGKQYKLVPIKHEEQDDIFDYELGDICYYRSEYDTTSSFLFCDSCKELMEKFIEKCNFCKDKKYININCLETELHDRLRKFSYQHGWNNQKSWSALSRNSVPKYYISFDYNINNFCEHEVLNFYNYYTYNIGVVYFETAKIANEAIKEVIEPFCKLHPEYLQYIKGEYK